MKKNCYSVPHGGYCYYYNYGKKCISPCTVHGQAEKSKPKYDIKIQSEYKGKVYKSKNKINININISLFSDSCCIE